MPHRMNADEMEPEPVNESSALVADASIVASPLVQITELRNQLDKHARRLRELEAQLRGQAGSTTSTTALSPFRTRASPTRSESPSRNEFESRPSATEAVRSEHSEVASVHSGQTTKRRQGLANTTTVRSETHGDADPYTRMFASSRMKHERMFDQELLMSIYDKPYQRMRHQAALFSSGIMGLLAMPFGPIGMVGGALLGALVGAILGGIVDMRRIRAKLEDSEIEKKRLKSLLRWASERYTEDDEILSLIEMVTLEFKPIADIAPKSNNGRKLLKMLDQWIAKKTVTRQIWVYMEQLLLRWRELPREQLMRSMLVLQTLTTMYQYSNRALDETELSFVRRMERLLAHESVQSVIAHAQQNVPQGDVSKMESMVYADAMSRTPTRASRGTGPNDVETGRTGGLGITEDGMFSDDEDEANARVQRPNTPSGVVMISPSNRSARPQGEPSPTGANGSCSARSRNMVLKKPFFRDWEDFMDFDDTIKHKMPITLCEFDLLLQKEAEDTKNWDLCIDRKDLKVAKIMSGPGMITIRAWAIFPGVDVNTAFYLFYNLDERTKWDKTFCKMQVIDSDIQGSDVVYCLMKIPTVTSRDFLQYRRVRVLEDGSILIVLRSADHPDMPEEKSYIRVENKISGYILRQTYEDGKPVLRMFLMTCSDVKGMIPKWIINFLAPKKPAEWMDALRKAAVDYQSSNTGNKHSILNIIQKFKDNHPWDYELEASSVDADENAFDVRLQETEGSENTFGDPVSLLTPSTLSKNGKLQL